MTTKMSNQANWFNSCYRKFNKLKINENIIVPFEGNSSVDRLDVYYETLIIKSCHI